MNSIVITEIHLAARLFRSGILKYFNNQELNFYITDFCYDYMPNAHHYDKAHAKLMLEEGMLKVVGLDERQMKTMAALHQQYRPKFIIKTISALVVAKEHKFKLVSEDELLREVARKHLNVQAFNKEWLITTLVNEITMMGESIDINDVKQII
jgi:hypothetical protein